MNSYSISRHTWKWTKPLFPPSEIYTLEQFCYWKLLQSHLRLAVVQDLIQLGEWCPDDRPHDRVDRPLPSANQEDLKHSTVSPDTLPLARCHVCPAKKTMKWEEGSNVWTAIGVCAGSCYKPCHTTPNCISEDHKALNWKSQTHKHVYCWYCHYKTDIWWSNNASGVWILQKSLWNE